VSSLETVDLPGVEILAVGGPIAGDLRARYGGSEHDEWEFARRILALSAIQLSCGTGALEEVTAATERGEDVDVWLGRLESRARLSQDSRRWSDTVRKWADALGYTPVGRAQLEAASQPRGISMEEARQFAAAVFEAAFEFVDRTRRQVQRPLGLRPRANRRRAAAAGSGCRGTRAMTLRVVPPKDQDALDDATFYRELLLRAELVAARLALGYWQRRVRQLEAHLSPSDPLRSRPRSDG
jgi:hypothetical protein